MTHWAIIEVLRFPPKIVTAITGVAKAVPRGTREAGGTMTVSIPI